MDSPLNIVFVAAHMEGLAPFTYMLERGDHISGLVTLDSESRGKVAGAVDFAQLAEPTQIPTLLVHNINQPEAVAWIRQKAPDLILVVGWTQLLKPDLLRVPKFACLGFHASLLPKYRGRAPVNWAIINGETVTGNTMITLEPEADTGDIVAQRKIPITDEDDCNTIYQKVGQTEVEMLEEILPLIQHGILPRRKQDDSQATVMPKRRPEDGLINWNRSAKEVYNWVRALTDPYPGAFSFLNAEKIKIWAVSIGDGPIANQNRRPGQIFLDSQGWPWVSTGEGWIRILSVQREIGPKISGDVAARTLLRPGSMFGDTKGLRG